MGSAVKGTPINFVRLLTARHDSEAVPDTSVTLYPEDIGNTSGRKGFAAYHLRGLAPAGLARNESITVLFSAPPIAVGRESHDEGAR
jgi:hypothetical protein